MKTTLLSLLTVLALPVGARAALPAAQLKQNIRAALVNHYVSPTNTRLQLRSSGLFYATHKYAGGTVAHVKGRIDVDTGAIESFKLTQSNK
jgi:hypothetical protein